MTTLRIPRRFMLRGQEWTVVRKKRIRKDGQDCSGLAHCGGENRIDLLAARTPPQALHAFLHEIVHAALPLELIPLEHEEKVAEALAYALPDIVRALVKEG